MQKNCIKNLVTEGIKQEGVVLPVLISELRIKDILLLLLSFLDKLKYLHGLISTLIAELGISHI